MQIPESFFKDFKKDAKLQLMEELLDKADFCYESLCVSYSDHELYWDDFVNQEEELDLVISSMCKLFPEILEFVIEKMDSTERLYYYVNTRIFLQLEKKDFLMALVMKINWNEQKHVLGFFDALCHSETSDSETMKLILESMQIKKEILEIYQILTGLKETLSLVTEDNLVYASRYNLPAKETDIILDKISEDISVLDLMYLCKFQKMHKEIRELLPDHINKNKWHFLSAALLHDNEYLKSCWNITGNSRQLNQALALEGTPENYRLLISALKEDNERLITAECLRFMSGAGRYIWQQIDEVIPEDELLEDEIGSELTIKRDVEELDCSYEYWNQVWEDNKKWVEFSAIRWGKPVNKLTDKKILKSSIPGLWRYYILFSEQYMFLNPVLKIKKQKNILEE